MVYKKYLDCTVVKSKHETLRFSVSAGINQVWFSVLNDVTGQATQTVLTMAQARELAAALRHYAAVAEKVA
jgi:hypothetical protein